MQRAGRSVGQGAAVGGERARGSPFNSILTGTLRGRHLYTHFADEETEAPSGETVSLGIARPVGRTTQGEGGSDMVLSSSFTRTRTGRPRDRLSRTVMGPPSCFKRVTLGTAASDCADKHTPSPMAMIWGQDKGGFVGLGAGAEGAARGQFLDTMQGTRDGTGGQVLGVGLAVLGGE